MKIELRALQLTTGAGTQAPLFTAQVWIDGQAAFRAENRSVEGHIRLSAIGQFDLAAVNVELARDHPPIHADDHVFPTNLELEVARLADRAAVIADLLARMRMALLVIEDERVIAYPITDGNREMLRRSIRTRRVDAVIIDPADEHTLERAASIILDADQPAAGSRARRARP